MMAAFAKRMRSREMRSGANPAFPTSFSIAAIGSIETSSSKSKRARILRCCKLFAQRVDVRSRASRSTSMPKQQITSSKIRQPSGHFSHATMVEARGRIVFISGMTARRPDGTIAGVGDIEAQTRHVCENLKAAVEEAGGSMDDICRVDVYVRNMEHFEQIHKVRREYFRPPAPASTMVEVCKMTSPDYLIEINAIAVISA